MICIVVSMSCQIFSRVKKRSFPLAPVKTVQILSAIIEQLLGQAWINLMVTCQKVYFKSSYHQSHTSVETFSDGSRD